MKFITRLMPREGRFFLLFNEHAAHVRDGGIAIVDLLAHYDDPIARSKYNDQIEKLEHKADRVTRDTVALLHQTFVTPFDREDIQNLANHLDDVLDEMRAAADLAQVHQVTTPLPGVSELVSLLRQIAEVNVELIGKLSTLKKLNDVVDRIDALEREADGVYRRVMGELFNGGHDALDILKWKDVVEAIERAINAVQDASGVVESIAVKHA